MRNVRQPSQNRADAVRQRRTQSSQERSNTAAGRASNPGTSRSRQVVMRGGAVSNNKSGYTFGSRPGTPVYRQTATQRPRRQFYVAMDSAGAEMRLPAIPVIAPGWRLLSGLLAIFLAIGVFSMWNSPFFRISVIDVQGLQRLNSDHLDAVMHLENLSIVEVNAAEVQQEIETSFPELDDVQVSVALPNYVTVSARERQPVLAWQKGDTALWIDSEGVIFPARGDAGPLATINTQDDIPLAPLANPAAESDESSEAQPAQPTPDPLLALLQAPAENRRAELKLINATLQLVKELPEGTQIVFAADNGLGWTDPGGWQVYIGKDMQNFEEKLSTYRSILQNLQDQGIQPVLISVEHLNAPFYRAVEQSEGEEQ